MFALKLSGAFLYVLATAYIAIGVLHSFYFQFSISRSDCIAATKGIIYVYCHTGTAFSHLVACVAWPWYWL
jgi:hypothetical protein